MRLLHTLYTNRLIHSAQERLAEKLKYAMNTTYTASRLSHKYESEREQCQMITYMMVAAKFTRSFTVKHFIRYICGSLIFILSNE